MPSLAQTSKTLGLSGTAILHSTVVLACFFFMRQSIPIPTPLPPSVQALRITLAEPVSEFHAQETTTPPKTVPQPRKAPVTPKKPGKPPPTQPAPSPKPLPETVSEALVEPLGPLPETASEISTSTAAIQPPSQGNPSQKVAETQQSLLSTLIASLEREKRYPSAARRLGIEGLVMAQVQLDSRGRIIAIQAKASEREAMLERATLEALQRVQNKWNPVPIPEPATLNVPVRYSLTSS